MKKLIIVLAFIFVFTSLSIFAIQPDFTGDFTFELRANPKDLFFDHSAPAEFADINAAFDFKVDDYNTVHTEIGGVSGGSLDIKDAYLKTEWGFMTTELGDICYESMGYVLSSKEYESKTKDIEGPGVFVEIPIGEMVTLSGAKTLDPCYGGFGLKFSSGIIDGIGISYFADVLNNNWDYEQTFTVSSKIIVDEFSLSAGFRHEDLLTENVFVYGIGAKYNLNAVWFAGGIGVEEKVVSIGLDTGVDLVIWGGQIAVGIVEKLDCVNVEGWYKIGEVKLTGGYDYNVQAKDELFVKVEASF